MALILDTGPLYASLDRSDQDHAACRSLIEGATEPLVIPAPVLVEVDYWIGQRLGPGALVALLADIEAGAYAWRSPGSDYTRVRELCDRYADADIGFVDAAVLAIVERLGEPKLATLDRRHFALLRPRHMEALELLRPRPERDRLGGSRRYTRCMSNDVVEPEVATDRPNPPNPCRRRSP